MLFRTLAGRWQEKQERGWQAASSKIQGCCCACNGVGTRAEVAVAGHRREPATIKQKSRPAAAEIKLERGCNQLVSANKIYQKGIRQQPFKSIASASFSAGGWKQESSQQQRSRQRRNGKMIRIQCLSKPQANSNSHVNWANSIEFYCLPLDIFGFDIWHLHRLEFGAQRPPICTILQRCAEQWLGFGHSKLFLGPFGSIWDPWT